MSTGEWIIEFPGTNMTLRGTGEMPRVVQASTPAPAPAPASTPAPAPEPAPVENPDDNGPFVWPPQPPVQLVDPPEKRNYPLTMNDASPMRWFYATPPSDPNPSPGSHLFAGMLPGGMRVSYGDPPRLIERLALWVPASAQPYLIRRALGGRIVA